MVYILEEQLNPLSLKKKIQNPFALLVLPEQLNEWEAFICRKEIDKWTSKEAIEEILVDVVVTERRVSSIRVLYSLSPKNLLLFSCYESV